MLVSSESRGDIFTAVVSHLVPHTFTFFTLEFTLIRARIKFNWSPAGAEYREKERKREREKKKKKGHS